MLLKVPTVTVFFLLLSTYILMFLQYAHNNNLCSLFRSVFFLLLIHTCFTLQEKKEKLHLMHTPLSSQTQSTLTH